MTTGLHIRPATAVDAGAIARIYGHYVLHGFGTFEEVPPSPGEMVERWRAIASLGLPYLVAIRSGCVAGYACAGPFRPRSGYRHTLEDSVYVAPDAIGQGIGRALPSAVIDIVAARGTRQLMAVIGDSNNQASIGLHEALGFRHAGFGRGLGWKHEQWVDVVWMQKALNGGDTHPAAD